MSTFQTKDFSNVNLNVIELLNQHGKSGELCSPLEWFPLKYRNIVQASEVSFRSVEITITFNSWWWWWCLMISEFQDVSLVCGLGEGEVKAHKVMNEKCIQRMLTQSILLSGDSVLVFRIFPVHPVPHQRPPPCDRDAQGCPPWWHFRYGHLVIMCQG